MAHKGRFYPVSQQLRYIYNTVLWPFYAAVEYDLVVTNWVGSITLPSSPQTIRCTLSDWHQGDDFFEFRGPVVTAGSEIVQAGWRYELRGDGFPGMRKFGAFWVNGVRQYNWDSNDGFNNSSLRTGQKLGTSGRVSGWVLASDHFFEWTAVPY